MNIKRLLFLNLLVISLLNSGSVCASDGTENTEKHPWLKGVSIEMVPSHITPVIPMQLFMGSGEPLPKELNEDETIVVNADSEIFFSDPPTKDRNMEIPNPVWVHDAVVKWKVTDWGKNKSDICDFRPDLPGNQMEVKPLYPTDIGSIDCHVSRKMSYEDLQSGKKKFCFANSSRGVKVKIKDITPPTCGLQISVKDGGTSTILPVENPPNEYPLPKHADLMVHGSLTNGDPDYKEVIQGLELGAEMVAPINEAGITLSRKSVVKLAIVGDDNYKLNNEKFRFGITSVGGGEPAPLGGKENEPEIDLSEIKLPDAPFFYLVAEDMAGNKEVLFIPIKLID